MAAPTAYGFNLLEKATAVVTVANESTSQPKERLFDRDVGLTYRSPASTATREVKVNVPSNTEALTAWVVSSCHGFVNATLTLDSSPDNAAWTNRDAFTPTSSGRIVRAIASVTTDWWRLQATGTTGTIDVGELLLTRSFAFPTAPKAEGPVHRATATVARHESLAGKVWKASLAEERWEAEWGFANMTSSERDTTETFFKDDLAGGAKAFYLTDPEGATRWVEWLDTVADFKGHSGRFWDLSAQFREVF